MYNLIKRALVTIDENEKVKLYQREQMTKGKGKNENQGQKDSKLSDSPDEVERGEFSPAISLAREKARVIIEEAEKEAEKIRKKAESYEAEQTNKINEMKAKAEKDVKTKEEQIRKQWENRLKNSLNALNSAKDALDQSKSEYTEITSEKIKIILSKLFQKVLLIAMDEHHQEIMKQKIKEMITRVMSLKEIVFKFNPADIKMLPDDLKKEMRETLTSFDIRQDASISKGGVIVETNYGTLDGTLENQLEIINDMVEQIFGEEE